MDAETKARYEAWKWKRIRQRLIIPGIGLLLLIVVILVIRSCSSHDEIPEVDTSDATVTRQPPPVALNYLDFDFTVYDEHAISMVREAELDDYLVLVNKVFRLPADFSPESLTAPQVLSVGGVNNTDRFLRLEATDALENLFAAAWSEAELTLWLSNGYRSYDTQMITHQHFVDLVGREEGEMISARPGHCEHQTGLAASVTAPSVGGYLIQELSATAEGAWLRDNAHRFGFIMRYPEGEESTTGFRYEPWSIRYVGTDVAAYIFENDIVLEQYVLPYTLSRP